MAANPATDSISDIFISGGDHGGCREINIPSAYSSIQPAAKILELKFQHLSRSSRLRFINLTKQNSLLRFNMSLNNVNAPTDVSESGTPIGDDSTSLPSWAQAATQPDGLTQPWKADFGTQDNSKFDEGKDLFVLYKDGVKACSSEGTLAA